MAWVARTWETGLLVDSVAFNEMRDNYNSLGTHAHNNLEGSGDGGGAIGPLEFVTFADTAGPPLIAAGRVVMMNLSGTLAFLNSTGTYFTIDATHTHTAFN